MSVEGQREDDDEHVEARVRSKKARARTGTDTLPDVDLSAFGVPYTTLRALGPKDVEFPYAGGVRDKARHWGGNGCVWGSGAWSGLEREREGALGGGDGREGRGRRDIYAARRSREKMLCAARDLFPTTSAFILRRDSLPPHADVISSFSQFRPSRALNFINFKPRTPAKPHASSIPATPTLCRPPSRRLPDRGGRLVPSIRSDKPPGG